MALHDLAKKQTDLHTLPSCHLNFALVSRPDSVPSDWSRFPGLWDPENDAGSNDYEDPTLVCSRLVRLAFPLPRSNHRAASSSPLFRPWPGSPALPGQARQAAQMANQTFISDPRLSIAKQPG